MRSRRSYCRNYEERKNMNETERKTEFTDGEKHLISKVFQNYYCMGLMDIAEEDETAKSLFIKVGLFDPEDFTE